MITHLFIFSLAVQAGTALSSKFGFQVGQSTMLKMHGGKTSETEEGKFSSNFTYRSEDVISFADGVSNHAWNCYHFANFMSIFVAENIQTNAEGGFGETRGGVFNAIRGALKKYKQILDNTISTRVSKTPHKLKKGSYQAVVGSIQNALYDRLSCNTSFNASFIADSDESGSSRLNIVGVGDSNVTYFKLINDHGRLAYIPTVVTDNGTIAPGDYKNIESAGYLRLQNELEQYSGLKIIKPIAMAAYSSILNEQFQMYSVDAAVNDLVLSANKALYDSIPLPLLTIFINYSIKSLESSIDSPHNVSEKFLHKIVNRFCREFNDLIVMEQNDYLEAIDKNDFQELNKHFEGTNSKAKRVYDQLLESVSQKARRVQGFDSKVQLEVFKSLKNEHEHFKQSYLYVKTSDKHMEFVDTTPFDIDAYLKFNILKQMGLADENATGEDPQGLFNPYSAVSLFGSCAFKDLVEPMVDVREIGLGYASVNGCVQNALSKLTFEKNFFNEHGYAYLNRMIVKLAKNLQQNEGFKATPLMHNELVGKPKGSDGRYMDPSVFVTRIKEKDSHFNESNDITKWAPLEQMIANGTKKMKERITGFVGQYLAEHFEKPQRPTKRLELI